MDRSHDFGASRAVPVLLETGFWASFILALIGLVASALLFMLIKEFSETPNFRSRPRDFTPMTILFAYAAMPFFYSYVFLRGREAYRSELPLPIWFRYFAWLAALFGAGFFAGYVWSLIDMNCHGPCLLSPVMAVFGPVLALALMSLVSLVTLLLLPSPFGRGVLKREAS